MRDLFLVLSQSYSPPSGPLRPLPPSYSHLRGQDSPLIAVAVVMVVVLITLSMMGALWWCWRKAMAWFCSTRTPFLHRRSFSVQAPIRNVQLMSIPSGNLALEARVQDVMPIPVGNLYTGAKEFSYQELATATDNFSNILGKGGFGSVYEGKLGELKVAIKRLNRDSQQGVNGYKSEVTTLSRLRHRNIVQLIGCHDNNDLLVVYELMPKGSLDKHLHSDNSVLPWGCRYKIALDLAYALAYIHEDFDRDHFVLHKDIKPSNIMIGDNFDAKLGDFGLARLVDHGQSAHTTNMAGTFGYMDPHSNGDVKSDMYSFGVILLEMGSGQPPIIQIESQRSHISDLVLREYRNGGAIGLADPRLQGNFVKEQLNAMILVGLRCVQSDPTMRLSAKEAIKALELGMSSEIPMDIPADRYGSSVPGSSLFVNSDGASSGSSDGTLSSASSESPSLADTRDLNYYRYSLFVNSDGVSSGSSDGTLSSASSESPSLADTHDLNSDRYSLFLNSVWASSGSSDGTMCFDLLDEPLSPVPSRKMVLLKKKRQLLEIITGATAKGTLKKAPTTKYLLRYYRLLRARREAYDLENNAKRGEINYFKGTEKQKLGKEE